MQQHSSSRRTRGQGAEMEGLLAELRRVLERIAQIGPPETVTVPLALPMELADLMVQQAQGLGLETPHIYVSCLLHGQFHAAQEHGSPQATRRIAAMIRRMASGQEWERFVAQHPEAREDR